MTRLFRLLLMLLVAAPLVLAGVSAAGVWHIESEHPPVGDFVEVSGQRLHYTDHGVGPPIVLVHGANSSLFEFQHSLVPVLARRNRVLVFDRPGYGYTPRGDAGWLDPADLADVLISASEKLGAPRPTLVGHSWSGSVVMSALVHQRERVAGGVLLAGAAGHWVEERGFLEALRDWPWLNRLFAHTLVVPAGSLLLPGALETVFAPHPVPEGHAERVSALLALRPQTFLANAEDLDRLSAYLQRESTRYPSITSPLLVVHGTSDTLVPYWNHGDRLQSAVHGVEVALLDGHGHALHHVASEQVGALIRDFVTRTGL